MLDIRRLKLYIALKHAVAAANTPKEPRWFTLTTTAHQDRHDQWITRQAIKTIVKVGDATQIRGPLRYAHLPIEFGMCDFQTTLNDGTYLLESGTFFSNKHAQVVAQAARNGWQVSPQLRYPENALQNGAFHAAIVTERSILPPNAAANYITALFTQGVD
jgi:hypothetical protein